MQIPNTYQQLEPDTVEDYLAKQHPTVVQGVVGQVTGTEELSDGNLNRVFLIKGTKQSVIVKQALPFVRVVPTQALGLQRIYHEFLLLEAYSRFSDNGECVPPKVHVYDADFACIVMEYLGNHKVLRTMLAEKQICPQMGKTLGESLANVLFATSDFGVTGREKWELIQRFSGNHELEHLTGEVVFTCPYLTSGGVFDNKWTSPHLDQVAADIQSDSLLKIAATKLKHKFLSSTEALIHADLHTGSFMATPNGEIRVMDCEFGFVGPIAFDVGTLLGNLCMAWFGAGQQDPEYEEDFLTGNIVQFWNSFHGTFSRRSAQASATSVLLKGNGFTATDSCVVKQGFLNDYLHTVFVDSLGFAGTEIIRRILGVAHVEDFERIQDKDVRARRESEALMFARELMLLPETFPTIEHVMHRMKRGTHRMKQIVGQGALSFKQASPICATILLVAKFPRVGRCKTRLSADGRVSKETAFRFAQACVHDLVDKFASQDFENQVRMRLGKPNAVVHRKIIFAPAEDEQAFRAWLNETVGVEIAQRWSLEAFQSPQDEQLTHRLSHGLGCALESAWADCEERNGARADGEERSSDCEQTNSVRGTCEAHAPVAFIGMDTPQLSAQQVVDGFEHAARGDAFISPAADGGYVLLTVPGNANPKLLFDSKVIVWSCESTCATQIKAILGAGLGLAIGDTFMDVDEVDDLLRLVDKLDTDKELRLELPRVGAILKDLGPLNSQGGR